MGMCLQKKILIFKLGHLLILNIKKSCFKYDCIVQKKINF